MTTKEISYRKQIFYNEINQNLHVNNSQYLDWVTDCFDIDHYKHFSLSTFSCEFLSETHWGDEVELRTGTEDMIFRWKLRIIFRRVWCSRQKWIGRIGNRTHSLLIMFIISNSGLDLKRLDHKNFKSHNTKLSVSD